MTSLRVAREAESAGAAAREERQRSGYRVELQEERRRTWVVDFMGWERLFREAEMAETVAIRVATRRKERRRRESFLLLRMDEDIHLPEFETPARISGMWVIFPAERRE